MSGYDVEQPNHPEPSYLSALGLNKNPFPTTYQDDFLYLDTERNQRIQAIHQLAQNSNLLLLVTGEHGVGKTSLLKRFTLTADDNCSVCEVQANTMMDAEQLLVNIARGFGLHVTNQPSTILQDTLYQYLITIKHNGQAPLLVIDDAHELPKDALQTLFTLADAETGEGNLLGIILFCEPQIEIMLESPSFKSLRERITNTMDIPPFNEEQTAEYIKHRLAVSGFSDASPFKPRDIRRVYAVSHGVPLRINELAHLHLKGENYAPEEPEHLPEEFTRLPFNKKRIAAGASVLTLVLIVLLFRGSDDSIFKDELPVVTQVTEINRSQTSPVIEPLHNKQKSIELTINPEPGATSPLSESTDEPVSQKTEPASTTPPEPPVRSKVRSILPNPVIGSRNKQTILLNGDGFSKDTSVTLSWTGNKKKLDSAQVSFENRNQLRIHIIVGSKADNWTVQTDDPIHGKSNIHEFKVTAAPVTGLQTIKWINQQSPEQFTLQLLGTYNKYSLTSLVKQHKLDKDTAYFSTKRNGRNWYTLVHGRFESREAAKQAVADLPAALQSTKPWVRRFDSIQTAAKTTNKTNDVVIKTSGVTANDNSPPQSLDLTTHAAWLWSQNPQHFTIQLLGGHNLDALRSFMQKHQLQNQAYFYRTRRNGKQWFVLLHGSYTDHEKARSAIRKLPAEISKTRPWPRRFEDIHGELSSQ